MNDDNLWKVGVRYEEIGIGTNKYKLWSFVHIKNDVLKLKLRMGGTVKNLDQKLESAQKIASHLNTLLL